jgi:hypothetical protein
MLRLGKPIFVKVSRGSDVHVGAERSVVPFRSQQGWLTKAIIREDLRGSRRAPSGPNDLAQIARTVLDLLESADKLLQMLGNALVIGLAVNQSQAATQDIEGLTFFEWVGDDAETPEALIEGIHSSALLK